VTLKEPLDLSIDAAGIARLTLNRPKRANSLDAGLTDALVEAVARCAANADIRVVVVQATGRAFCAGIDIARMKEAGAESYEANYQDAMKLATMLRALRMLPVPVVAVVQGPAIGLGVGLAAACDIAIAADTASFRLTEIRLGILPAVISPYLLDAIGERACRRYFLSAEAFSAAEALRLGLLQDVRPPEGLEAAVSRIVTELLAGKPGAQEAAKALIEAQRSPALDEALIADTARRLTDIRGGKEAQDALSEFLKK
jgi:methylglutaconyl-CoA hydratase